MQQSEMIAVGIFLGSIFTVYGLECGLFVKYVASKLQRHTWKGSRRRIFLHILSISGVLCFLYGYFIEPYWIEVTTVTIHTHKLTHHSLRLVQFSDTHCDAMLRNEHHIVTIINNLKPDIIVFTGDTLNTRQALPAFQSLMKGLQAPFGKYAVKGNFDIWYWTDLDLFKDTGVTVLDNDALDLTIHGDRFVISGLSCAHPENYSTLLKDLTHDTYNIFLHHYPDLVEDVTTFPVDLYLAGHTHGGQVALPFYGALVTLSKYGKRYESGKYLIDNTLLYVNRGIGMEGGAAPRVRFWARPEITIFDITPKAAVVDNR